MPFAPQQIMDEEIEPAPPADRRGGEREQGEHFDGLIERGLSVRDPKRLAQHDTEQKQVPARLASRVKSPSSRHTPMPVMP